MTKLKLLLTDMCDRIEKSELKDKNKENMYPYFIIIVPESGKTPAKFGDIDSRFSTVGPLDDGIKKSRAGHPSRPYRNFAHQVKTNEVDNA